MPKSDLLPRIDQHPPDGAIVVGGVYQSRQAVGVAAVMDVAGNVTVPSAAGQLTVSGQGGLRATAEPTALVLEVDGTIPRLGFTGRQVVGRGTTLMHDLPADGTELLAAEDAFAAGDLLLVQARGGREYIAVEGAGVPEGDAYAFPIARDQDGGGAYAWRAGDVIMRLGQAGDHFLELAGQSNLGGTVTGPRLAVQQVTDGAPDTWQPVVLLGNLAGHYGLGGETPFGSPAHWGFAAGLYGVAGEPWVLVESGAGVQLGRGSALGLHLTPDGDIDQYAGAEQRTHLAADGSGWLAGSDKIFWDTDGNLTIAGTIQASAGSLDGALTLGSAGGIYQGTGTFGAPDTGLKIWNDAGVGRIGGYNAGVLQWAMGTDGKLYAGGSDVALDASGITLGEGMSDASAIAWGDKADPYSRLRAYLAGTPEYIMTELVSGGDAIAGRLLLQAALSDGSPGPRLTLSATADIATLFAGTVGIDAFTPGGKLHVNQSDYAGAMPVLVLEQRDADQDMIRFSAAVGVGNAIEAVGAKTLTVTHFVKVDIAGVGTRYLPVGTIA